MFIEQMLHAHIVKLAVLKLQLQLQFWCYDFISKRAPVYTFPGCLINHARYTWHDCRLWHYQTCDYRRNETGSYCSRWCPCPEIQQSKETTDASRATRAVLQKQLVPYYLCMYQHTRPYSSHELMFWILISSNVLSRNLTHQRLVGSKRSYQESRVNQLNLQLEQFILPL